MKIEQNHNLSKLNTFGITAKAKFFVEVKNEEDLKDLFNSVEFKNNEKLFLGGGSNILFTKDFDGIVILNKLKGIEILRENNEEVLLKAMGGELWNDFVNFAVINNYWGVENLSLIPGSVGATPVQNIGAYGVEVKDIIENVEAYDINTGEKSIFNNKECEFGYRDSVFKNKLKGKYFISAVIFKLSKIPNLNIEYKVLKDYLNKNKIQIKNVKDISDAVAEIRRSKLPNPKILGNAGSFFKNIYVPARQPALAKAKLLLAGNTSSIADAGGDSKKFEELKEKYPDIIYFEENNMIKIPAGWLIEKCGWKGKRVGNVGVHDKQALVLVNYGGASGEEVKNVAEQIIASVFEKFGLKLTLEVNIV